ncbi:MAG: hydrogenase maturation nickel metallochaperone HypA [Candidatus Aadella gelida]|nr:hydrogenase maturation nickel metallochaperone HypA [Candidatus Aadella gelida]
MHEMKLIESMVSILNKEVDDVSIHEVKEVHLEVGELRYIVPEIMENCFKHVPKSIKLKNAKLKVMVVPGGKEFTIKGIEY